MKKHILVISQYFYPEEFRINDICKEWIKRGYEVTVVTGMPNYPEGKFYNGYGWFRRTRDEYEGIHIIRLPIIPRGKNSIMLALNYASFVVAGFFWKLFTRVRADKVFIFEVSPMTQALVGVWYAKKRKIPCFIYVQDLWPENVQIVTGINNKHVIHAIDKMVDYIYEKCDKIFATSPSFVKQIEKRESAWKEEASKVVYWPQYAEDFYKPMEKKVAKNMATAYGIQEDDSFKIIFTGNVGTAQGLQILTEAATILKHEKVRFVIVGEGRYLSELCAEISRANISEMFIMIPRQPAQKIPMLLASCDAAFVSFSKNDLWDKTIPAKLQSYMACGMPIIASAQGETKRIINEAECGVCCRIGDAKALSDAILDIMTLDIKRMGECAKIYYDQHFDKLLLMESMEEFIEMD